MHHTVSDVIDVNIFHFNLFLVMICTISLYLEFESDIDKSELEKDLFHDSNVISFIFYLI